MLFKTSGRAHVPRYRPVATELSGREIQSRFPHVWPAGSDFVPGAGDRLRWGQHRSEHCEAAHNDGLHCRSESPRTPAGDSAGIRDCRVRPGF